MLSLALISLVVAATPTQLEPAQSLSGKLDALGSEHFRGVIYIEQDGKEIFFHAVGPADPESGRRFNRTTGIEIGSIVKPFVSVAIYGLAAQGKISLDDSIAKYFPTSPPDKAPITINMLLHHTSGFQDTFGDDYEPMPRDVLIGQMLKSKLLFAPGTQNQYSNSGFSMLSTILEKVTGERLEEYLHRTEFVPLGLKRTGYVLPHWRRDQVAIGTGPDGKNWGAPIDHFWYPDGPGWNLRGNGGMLTTVAELARWCRAAHNGELLTPDSYAKYVPAFAKPTVSPNAMWAVAGGNGVFNCVLAYNKSRKLTIVAFSADGRLEIEKRLRAMMPLMFAMVDKPANG